MHENLARSFEAGFLDELLKLGMLKDAQLEGILSPGLIHAARTMVTPRPTAAATGAGLGSKLLRMGRALISPITFVPGAIIGTAAYGLGLLTKPKGMSWRQWMPEGTFRRTLGHFTGLPLGGGPPNVPFTYRPPSISGFGTGLTAGRQTPGAF